MALAAGPVSSVAVVACLLVSVGFGGWRGATLPTSPAEKVPTHQSIDAEVKQQRLRLPDGGLWTPRRAAFFRKTDQHCLRTAVELLPQPAQEQQHTAALHMRLPDSKLWTPHRAVFFRKTNQQCLKPAVEFLLQPAQEQQQDLASVTANEPKDFEDTPNPPAPGFTQANHLSHSFVDHLPGWGSIVPAEVGGSLHQLLPVPSEQLATALALACIVDLLLLLLGCWFCLRRRRSNTVDSSRCSDEAEEIQKPSKAGKDAGEDEARLLLQLLPSPNRLRRPSELHAAGDEAAEGGASPRSQGEPEPESSLELMGPDGAMEPFQDAVPEQKAAVLRRGSGEFAEVMRRCREGCNTWESVPDDSTADISDVGGAMPLGSGAASAASEFHVTGSPAVRRGSSDLREVMRQRRQVCEEFTSATLDSMADTTALEQAAAPGHDMAAPVQKDMAIAENPPTASAPSSIFRGKDDFVKIMKKRRESCSELRVLVNSPEADAPDTALGAPSQNDDARATTKAGELAMTPPSDPQARNGKELRSTWHGTDVARRQLHY